MPSFDPSIISQIPDFGPNPVEAKAQGFKLADLINEETLSRLKVSQEQKSQKESAFLSDLGKEFDMSKPEEARKAASKASKEGYPGLTTGILKQSQALELGQAQADEARFHLAGQVMTTIDEKVGNIINNIRAVTTGPDGKPLMNAQGVERYDTKTKDAMTVAAVAKAAADIESDESLSPQAKAMARQSIQKFMSQGQPTYDSVQKAYQQTQSGRAAYDKELARRKEVAGIKNLESEARDRDAALALKQQKARQEATGSTLSDEGRKLRDDLAFRDKSFMTRLSAGGIKERNQIINDWASQGATADDVIAGRIKTHVQTTEGGALARREAQLLPVEKSITKKGGFLDQAESAVNKVDFPKLKAAGRFENWTKEQESDPDLAAYKAAVAELRAEYSIVLSKGGQVTDAAREESKKVVPDLITKDQFKSIRKVILNGIEASKGGVEESIAGVTGGKTEPKKDDPLGIR